MPIKKRKAIARRVRFHAAWLAIFMLLDAVASMWSNLDGLLPVSPGVYVALGLVFTIASIAGHLIYRDL